MDLWESDSSFFPSWSTPFGGLFGGFSNVMRDFDRMSRAMEKQFRDVDQEFNWSPRADIKENSDSYAVSAELPGVPKENIKVEVDKNVLTIKGEKKSETEEKNEEGQVYRSERSYGTFMRQFALPEDVNAKNIKANYEHGVLKLTIPKSEASQKTEIKIE